MIASRIRMPLFAYIAVVAPALMGFLYAAEAMMGPPGAMPLTSEAPVLVKRQSSKAETVQILTVREPVAVPASALAWTEPTPEPSRQVAADAAETAPAQPVAATDGRGMSAEAGAEEPRKTVAAEQPRKKVAAVKKKKPVRVVRERTRHDVYAFERRQPSFFNVW